MRTLVHLKTGPKQPTKEEGAKIFAGHFENMGRLAREGHLLLAGPYGKTKHDPDLRGVFVLATADRATATKLAETDPAVQAGVFVLEYHTFATNAPLERYLARELAIEDQATREGKKLAPGEGGRSYVMLTAENGDAAMSVLAGHPGVLLLGRLDGSKALALLDAKETKDVPTLLGPALDRLGNHVLDGWFGGGQIAKLREL